MWDSASTITKYAQTFQESMCCWSFWTTLYKCFVLKVCLWSCYVPTLRSGECRTERKVPVIMHLSINTCINLNMIFDILYFIFSNSPAKCCAIVHRYQVYRIKQITVLNHDRTDYNTKPMRHWCMTTVLWSSYLLNIECNHFTG